MENTRLEVIDILDKMQFFQGQRAGRELWNEKPFNIQEQDIDNFNRHIRTVRDYICDLEHELKAYRDAEEQGLLLRLPCKVGDTVYEFQEIRQRIQPYEIISVNQGRMGLLYFNWELKDGFGFYGNLKGFGKSDIGKTVFLTKEEAEQKLESMKKGETK